MTDRQKYRELYWCWKAIKQRVLNPSCKAYHNYGARGIGMCKDWKEFEPFCEWALSNGWQKGLDLDRIDNDGPYCPENCRWVDRRTNTNNRRNTVFIEVDGETLPLTRWADLIGCSRGVIRQWIESHGKRYAAERISEAIKDGYKRNDYSRNHRRRSIVCLESGEEFTSIWQAAKTLGLNRGNVVRAIRTGGTTGGLHFADSGMGRFTWEEL